MSNGMLMKAPPLVIVKKEACGGPWADGSHLECAAVLMFE